MMQRAASARPWRALSESYRLASALSRAPAATPSPATRLRTSSFTTSARALKKNKHKSETAQGSVPVTNQKNHAGRKLKDPSSRDAELSVVGDESLPNESFDLVELENEMDDCVDRLQKGLRGIVARVERVSPQILDPIRVEYDGHRGVLAEYAAVSVKDGSTLMVNAYSEEYVKELMRAFQSSNLGLSPVQANPTSIRITVPKPDLDKRRELVRQASELAETARIAIRNARHKGQKAIKHDVDEKVVGKDEAKGEGKKLDVATQKRTAEVDSVIERARKVLMDKETV